jgi:hypothetical protein
MSSGEAYLPRGRWDGMGWDGMRWDGMSSGEAYLPRGRWVGGEGDEARATRRCGQRAMRAQAVRAEAVRAGVPLGPDLRFHDHLNLTIGGGGLGGVLFEDLREAKVADLDQLGRLRGKGVRGKGVCGRACVGRACVGRACVGGRVCEGVGGRA